MTRVPDDSVVQSQVLEGLQKCAGTVRGRGPGRWTAALENGHALRLMAVCDEDWLLLAAQPQGRKDGWPQAAAALPGLLALSARLPGAVRWAVAPGQRATHLRVDIGLKWQGGLAGRVRHACDSILLASRMAEAEDLSQAAGSGEGAPEPAPGATAADLGQLCSAAGWEARERACGAVAVPLEAPPGYYAAILEARSPGRVAVSTALVAPGVLTPVCRQARALLLLKAAAVTRMVRAAAEAEDGRSAERLEVAFEDVPDPARLHDALAALSVACRLCGEEVRALEDEALAGEYLRIQGWQ